MVPVQKQIDFVTSPYGVKNILSGIFLHSVGFFGCKIVNPKVVKVANVIRPIAQGYHFLSLKESQSTDFLLQCSFRGSTGRGKRKAVQGLVYSALNTKGEKLAIRSTLHHLVNRLASMHWKN